MRSRKEDGAGGDEGRQLRQQQVITAVAKKEAFSVNSVTKLNGIFKAAQDNLKTDLKLHTVKSL